MQEQSFEYKTKHLIDSYISIPIKSTINLFLRACFMHSTVNNELYYRNLRESDRECAYFSLRKSKEDKEFYYSRFPKSNNDILLTYDMFDTTPNKFENIIISDLSIEILNFIYFEYFLLKQTKVFKDNFNSLVDEYWETKTHQLLALENKFNEIIAQHAEFTNNDTQIEGLDYKKIYDFIEETHKKVNQFIESKFNYIKANNKNISLLSQKAREQNLLKIIDKANLDLFYFLEKWLIKEGYLDEENLNWIHTSGKSSFSRFYLKLEKFNIIKKGGGKKRKDKIRWLSNIYKIDGVTKYDYTPQNCKKADLKVPEEFIELEFEKSQFNLNSENN